MDSTSATGYTVLKKGLGDICNNFLLQPFSSLICRFLSGRMSATGCSPCCSAAAAGLRPYGRTKCGRILVVKAAMSANSPEEPTKLVTFLGKGGSGKSVASVVAAQYYAKKGLRTCLVIHSPDLTANYLMDCKIGTSPVMCNDNLFAVRLETTKMLLEPLDQVKKADSRVNFSQGALEGVVGEELGVLPGMDSIFTVLEIGKFTNLLRSRKSQSQPYDIIIYDGISTVETLRMIGAAEKARGYLKHLRNLAEKTDVGRLTAPSILKLIYESMGSSRGPVDGRTSAEIWDEIDINLRASATFANTSRLRSFLMIDPKNPISISMALRYWGCAIQAGSQISGAFGFSSTSSATSASDISEKISPLPFSLLPYISTEPSVDWDNVVNALHDVAKDILDSSGEDKQQSVKFDGAQKTVTLFMPGFDKSEIKLYQYRGGSELLVEAGDQRRIIQLPSGLQGKVGGAKFFDSNLVVTLR